MGEIISFGQNQADKLLALNPKLVDFVFKNRITKEGKPWGYFFESEKGDRQVVITVDNRHITHIKVLDW